MNYINFNEIRPLTWKLWYAYYIEAAIAFCWILFPLSLLLVDVYDATAIYSCPVVLGILGTIYRIFSLLSHLRHHFKAGVRLILGINALLVTPNLLLILASALALSTAPFQWIASGVLLVIAIGSFTLLLHIHRPIYLIIFLGVNIQVSLSILLICFKANGTVSMSYVPYTACLTPAATATLTLLSARKYLSMFMSPSLVVRQTTGR